MLDLDLSQRVVGSISDLWLEGIDATVLKPLVAPLVKLELLAHASIVFGIICLLECTDEIGELSIGPLVLLEVHVQCLFQSVLAKYLVGLLQE